MIVSSTVFLSEQSLAINEELRCMLSAPWTVICLRWTDVTQSFVLIDIILHRPDDADHLRTKDEGSPKGESLPW